jgi:hypothetical protein
MEGSLVAYKVFTNGSVLQASEINDNLMNQAVIAFTNSTSRASAITSPVEGMVTYLEDTNVHEFWNGSAWVALAAGIRNPVDTTNTAAGTDALNPSTTGTANTAFGRDALKANTTGNKNVSVGAYALDANTTGTGNVALGWSSAGATTTGNGNVAIGEEALLVNTTGGNNVSIGPRSMRAITTAGINVAVGDGAAYSLTTGTESVALGSYALYANTTGNYNTALGSAAGNANTTGSNNTTVGYNAQTSTTTVSNQITLGSNGVTSLRCNVTSISSLSDGRDKSNVKDSELGLDLVNKLRPVTFDWDRRDGSMSGVKDVGFIAQEVIEVEDDLEIFDTLRMSLRDNDEKYEVAPARLIPVLTKAIQELSKQNDDLMARLEKLENK